MGKVTGFMEFDRLDRDYAPVNERTQHYKEFLFRLKIKNLKSKVRGAWTVVSLIAITGVL